MTENVFENANQSKDSSLVKGLDTKNKLDLEILLELGNMGAGNATTSLSDMLHERIVVEVPKLHVAAPHLVPKLFGKHDQPSVGIYMPLRGSTDCDVLLLFEVEEAKKIVEMITMTPSPDNVDSNMKRSAIEELGSIMIGGFLSAISNFTGVELIPMPPELVTGSFDALLDGFLLKQALVSDVALVFDGCFRRTGSAAGGTLVVFPSFELQKLLVNKSQEWLNRDYSVMVTAEEHTFRRVE
ncbi:MAG: chemotaxis protein CheC [Candidatus Bathyarchaeota archaeon]|nr:chemotaxis protein CheC [Candidatus Bathyarchaeota archaeon]